MNKTVEKTLTIAQALKKGYEDYLYEGEGYQSLRSIADGDINFKRVPLLADKKFKSPSISAEELSEIIADYIEAAWMDETMDDTFETTDFIKEINFEPISKKINKVLLQKRYYRSTSIKLIP